MALVVGVPMEPFIRAPTAEAAGHPTNTAYRFA